MLKIILRLNKKDHNNVNNLITITCTTTCKWKKTGKDCQRTEIIQY